jgi:acetyltransferase-like isoleucine patch superfamily enzyme
VKIGHYIQLLVWKYFPIARPHKLKIKGKLLISFNTSISLEGKSQLIIDGDADFTNSNILLHNSTFKSGKIACDNSSITLNESDVELGDRVHIKRSVVNFEKSTLKAHDNFRLNGFELNANGSKLKIGNYFMGEAKLNHTPYLNLMNATFECGDNCRLQAYIGVSSGILKMGSHSFINHGTHLSCLQNITVGNHVMISYNCIIFDNNSHHTNYLKRRQEIANGFPNGTIQNEGEKPTIAPIIIEDDVWIGIASTVLKGVCIQSKSIVSSGTTVTKNVAENTMVYGFPNTYQTIT